MNLCINGIFPPWHLDIRVAFECLQCFVDVVLEQLHLSLYKVGVLCVAGPRCHVDDI